MASWVVLMILLVVGLVAVIVVVLIAVFLSIRLGRGDDPDELDIRPIGGDRRHAGEEDRWRERDARRVSLASARAAGRGPVLERERAARSRDYDDAPRRPARQEAPGYRRPAPARSPAVPVAAQARGRYDAGPQRPADDYPSADYPSMDFGPAGDHPSGELPAVGYGYPDDFPSEELPSVPARAPRRPPARPDRDRPDSRRKAAPAPGNGKGRSRQRGKRDDDDDWPSTEWDELSDEQYWAELSADKPLAAMAKPSRPASTAKPRPAADLSGAREARPARMPAAAPVPPQRDLPARMERDGLGARAQDTGPAPSREPVTERLPVRTRQQPPAPAAARDIDLPAAGRSYPTGPQALRDTGPLARHDSGPLPQRDTGPQPRYDSGPLPQRDTGPQPRYDSGPLPQRDTGPQPRYDGGSHALRDTGPHARHGTGPQPVRNPEPAPRSRAAGALPPIPGALDDDPLTSPSFSAIPATDSRSYSNARKHAKTESPGGAPASPDPGLGTSNGTGLPDGSYATAAYASSGYSYQEQAMPAAAAPPAAAAQWYSAPTVPTAEPQAPPYGNPYGHPGASSATGPAGGHDGTGSYGGYLVDPLRVYSPPAYQPQVPVQYGEPAGPAYHAQPALGVPYADGYPEHSYGPAEPVAYPDGYGAGYPAGYEAGYGGDPYGGYGTYPPQG